MISRKPRGKAYKKDGGFRHYLIKHPTANFLLQVDSFGYTYAAAKAEAVRLGGIVTNLSWATRNGCKPLPAGVSKETGVLAHELATAQNLPVNYGKLGPVSVFKCTYPHCTGKSPCFPECIKQE